VCLFVGGVDITGSIIGWYQSVYGATAGERRPFAFVMHFNNDVFVFFTLPWPGAVKQIILTGFPLFALFGLFCVVVVVGDVVVVLGDVVMVGVIRVINVVVVMGDICAFLSWGSEEINF
jgi:hypothetical protein